MKEERGDYFVYRHLRGNKKGDKVNRPFYIGLGHLRDRSGFVAAHERAYSKQSRSPYWWAIVNKHGYTVEIMVDEITLEEAREKEREFIKLYGRKDDGGILCNHNDGGDGNFNYKPTPETILKYKKALTFDAKKSIDKYVAYEPNTGCWLWTGTFDKKAGVPLMAFQLKSMPARRGVYEYEKNIKLAENEIIYNTCGNEYCVNPQHSLVSKKGDKRPFAKPQMGSKRWNSKFTEEDVLKIKQLKKEGKRNVDIAKIFNVTRQAIGLIARGINWKQI